MNAIRLGVNIDHVATIRNARGESYPDPARAAEVAMMAGADGITAHLREDRRHISDADIVALAMLARKRGKPLNFEMAATSEMQAFALAHRPHAACLVPERREEVTTEGGLDVVGQRGRIMPLVGALQEAGIRVSLFVEPDQEQIAAAHEVGSAGGRTSHRGLLPCCSRRGRHRRRPAGGSEIRRSLGAIVRTRSACRAWDRLRNRGGDSRNSASSRN